MSNQKHDDLIQNAVNLSFQSDQEIANQQNNQKEIRIFTQKMKEECWKKATPMIGKHPDRWRLDPIGNPVLKALKGCQGTFCHDYDHIIPYSKGGKTEVENCQILQSTVNKFKSNKIDLTNAELKAASPKVNYTLSELDTIERGIYGSILPENAPSKQK